MLPPNSTYPIFTQCPSCEAITNTEVAYIAKLNGRLAFQILICILVWGAVTGGMFADYFIF